MARIDKINEEVRRELAQILRTLKDSRIPMMTSVVSVSVTNDLRYAKAYISVMGDEETLLAGAFKVTWTPYTSSRFDSTRFKKEHAELAAAYTKTTTTRRFSVR